MNREATEGQNSAQNGPAYGAPASIDETGVPERWAKRADFAQHIQMQRSRRAVAAHAQPVRLRERCKQVHTGQGCYERKAGAVWRW